MAKRKYKRKKKAKALTPFQKVIFSIFGAVVALGMSVALAACPPSVWNEIFTAAGLEAQPLPALQMDENAVAIHFIDVGQADATLLQAQGEYCLVDAGEAASEQALLNYLSSMGVTKLKLLVMSHPHADHIGSMAAVLENLEVEQVLLPDFTKAPMPTTATFERVLDAVEAKSIPVITAVPGQEYAVGEATLTVIDAGVTTENYNDLSQVLYFDAPGLTAVLSGDGEKPVEKAALEQGVRRADVFKAAHHGSNTSNTQDFVQAIWPKYVVVSCGEGNSYGHPHAEPMQRFKAIGAQVLRTDERGSVVFEATPEGLKLYTAKQTAEKEAA